MDTKDKKRARSTVKSAEESINLSIKGKRRAENGVDIIIPVYNGLEDLKLCVESVKRNTDLSVDRVIILDDKSPDKDVVPYMKSIKTHGFVILENPENLGFSGTINRGIQYSKRDVILLNSDTIVTEGWVDKLVTCAYSDQSIGTVTPFSNNATLCSIPYFCQENVVPEGLSIDEYASVIEKHSLRKYPRITVAVGFCMYIKRETIDTVGLFDQETFQRGYGEENDFCWRAEQLGYMHVLCDDTYIYHSGSVSFQSEEKKKLIAAHERIVDERYPIQNHNNAVYVRDNPDQYLRDNVELYAKTANGKKNILYVLHFDFRADTMNSIGGTQFHVKDLMEGLRDRYNIFVAARDGVFLRLTIYTENDRLSLKFYIGEQEPFPRYYQKELARIWADIITAFHIDAVHVHHCSCLSLDIFYEAKKKQIPLIASLHDFYHICPTVVLLKNGETFCGGHCSVDCRACLDKQLHYTPLSDFLGRWQAENLKALKQCDVLITPSLAAKEVFSSVYPELSEQIRVIGHGMDIFELLPFAPGEADSDVEYTIEYAFENNYIVSGWAFKRNCDSTLSQVYLWVQDSQGKCSILKGIKQSRLDVANAKGNDLYGNSGFSVQFPDLAFETGPLRMRVLILWENEWHQSQEFQVDGYQKKEKTKKRIAFIGGLNKAKGSQMAYHMMKKAGDQYDWFILGGIGDPDLHMLEMENLHKNSWYAREEITTLLRGYQIDLVCILSIYPESFCYTLSEALLSGVPVLATEIGALGQRIHMSGAGWLVSSNASAKEVLDKINSIFSDQAVWNRVADCVASYHHKSLKEMCSDYDLLYQSLPRVKEEKEDYNRESILEAYLNADKAMIMSNQNAQFIQRISALEATLTNITDSKEYKILKYLVNHNYPCKKLLKKMALFCYSIAKKLIKDKK